MTIDHDRELEVSSDLIKDEAGASFIEKLVIIGLFILIVAAGIKFVGGVATNKLGEQGKTVEGINSAIQGQ